MKAPSENSYQLRFQFNFTSWIFEQKSVVLFVACSLNLRTEVGRFDSKPNRQAEHRQIFAECRRWRNHHVVRKCLSIQQRAVGALRAACRAAWRPRSLYCKVNVIPRFCGFTGYINNCAAIGHLTWQGTWTDVTPVLYLQAVCGALSQAASLIYILYCSHVKSQQLPLSIRVSRHSNVTLMSRFNFFASFSSNLFSDIWWQDLMTRQQRFAIVNNSQ